LDYEISNDGELTFSFQKKFISQKKIKKISSTFSRKKPNQTIQPLSKNSKSITYLRNGLVSEYKSQTYISSSKIKKHKSYFYAESKLAQTVELDPIGYFSEFYTYHNDTCFVSVYRSEDYSEDSSTARDSTFINSKAYVSRDNYFKELNSKLIEVNKRTLSYDSLGLLKREFTQHTYSPLLIDKHYDYDPKGNIAQIELATISTRKTFQFIYDNHSSLQTIEYYLNDKLVTKYEIVYNSDGWVTAFLKHDVDSRILEIEKLEYIFYE